MTWIGTKRRPSARAGALNSSWKAYNGVLPPTADLRGCRNEPNTQDCRVPGGPNADLWRIGASMERMVFKLLGVHHLRGLHGGLEPLLRRRDLRAVHGGLVPLFRLHHHRALPGGVELLCRGECGGGGLEPLHPAE